ncbi:hypothetical protein [Brevibacillus dissolubilis]|uniref:copper amine oxidase n=1 Tax=Brevibacillus dissolubilis TaxID=1844116 RepID=UPI00159B9136|nr:hypothetical protein [Brevibacillus dissolubilis]
MQRDTAFGELSIEIRPIGPSEQDLEQLIRIIEENPMVQSYLRGTRHLLLSFEWLDAGKIEGETGPDTENGNAPYPPDNGREYGYMDGRDDLYAEDEDEELFVAFRAIYYDYTNNRSVVVTGDLRQPDLLRVETSSIQPLPNAEEFALAVRMLEQDPVIGRQLRENQIRPYRPMPPLIEQQLPDGQTERILAVGLFPLVEGIRHEIVGVNMVRSVLIRYRDGAPPHAVAGELLCNPPLPERQSTTNRGIPGQVQIIFRIGTEDIWRFLAVRPSASSGTNGSGIELRNVRFRGKKVLARAHVPILIVRYDRDICGPFRDWQWEEGMIEAGPALQEVNSFRVTATAPRTILESDSDFGNFLGTVIHVEGGDVILTNEMEAGWYRYISQWRLSADGIIRPRFGFSAVANSCTCNTHHHHVYWRFDFDIRNADSNMVFEFNDPPIMGDRHWHLIRNEVRRPRDPALNRQWIVMNRDSREGYFLIPGPNDGTEDEFGVGDVWVLRYHGNEIDDGQGFTTDPNKARANLDKFLTGENVFDKDVVLWYAAHFSHGPETGGSHIVGPTLRPSRW